MTVTIPRHARTSRLDRAAALSRRTCARLRRSRAAWALGLLRLAVFILFHPSAPLPTGRLNIRIPDAPRGMRVSQLEAVAYAYRTQTERRPGWQVAERRFGPVRVEAHLKDDDYTAQLLAGRLTEGIAA